MASEKGCYVGFDLGGTKMLAVVTNRDFKVLARAKKKTKAEDGFSEGLTRMEACLEEALGEAGAGVESLLGIGFGLPGVLDFKAGKIVRLTNLGWTNVPLKKIFEEKYGAPVAIENDVNAGTYGECRFGAAKGCHDVVGIFPGTGIGGGIIIGGKIHHGVTGAAGELGHLVYDPTGPHCGCGNRGCFEAYASRVAISARAAEAVSRGKAPALQKLAGANLDEIRSSALAKSIKQGDKIVEEIVREAAYIVGILAADMINALSPSMIVLGGGLVEAMGGIYVDECKRAVESHAMPELRKGVRVAAAKLGDDSVALGAIALAAEAGKKE